jgi:type I restriction enzyme S subunit
MSWTETSIESLCETVASGGTPSRARSEFWDNGTIPWLKTGELNDGTVYDAEEKITKDGLDNSSAKIFPINTVLMAMYGDGRTITTLSILGSQSATNQACAAMIANPAICDYRFLFHALKLHRHRLLSLVVAGAQRNLSLGIIKRFSFPIPDLPTQTRIAGILSAYDDLIENNRRRIALLEQAARQLYREWFVHLRFPGHETTPFVDGLPEGWGYARVGDLGSVVTGKTPSKKVAANFDGNIPFIKTPDMHGNIFVLSSEETLTEQGAKTQPNKTIPAGSILVSCIGTVGVVAMTSCEAQFNQQINAVVPAAGISRIFCFYVLSALKPRLDAIGGGATMANVNKSKFESLEILMPSEAVHQAFEEAVRPIFDQIFALMRQNAQLTRARDLLLPRLMDGRIPV